MNGDVQKQIKTFEKLNEINQKFTTSAIVNVSNDPQLMGLHEQHDWQRYELFRKYEQFMPNKIISPIMPQSSCSSATSFEPNNTPIDHPDSQENQVESPINDISEDLRLLTEQRIPDLCILDDEPMEFRNKTKFYCTINDILTSDGEFWAERELSSENERKFHQFIEILALFANNYESLREVYIGQLVALQYESAWHRALVVSKSDEITITKQPSARVRLVDYGASLYVNVSQLKWLPEQFYLFPFKAVECVFSEAIKPTFSDTVRLTFKQLVMHKRLRATVYDRDGTRICVLLKCKTDEGIINVYRYLRAHEHKSKRGRMLDDGDIVQCLHNTIFNNSNVFEQTTVSNRSMNTTMNLTLPILSPPSPIQLTRDQVELRREEIKKILRDSPDEINDITTNIPDNKKIFISSSQSTPYSAATIITPLSRLSFTQQ
ncbi:unnamed protein product [Adineta ricciae]|uniref:Tudor domain-containing protein n=1 Tax=Adineta ricciae TaxID=249248 RepID=A0A813YJF8_ADIRI|nr:unnamed protein product [Adineta ricciae]CAF1119545.1 unnamed protein product [Adineta ricciae]